MANVYSQEFKDQIVELHKRGQSFMDLTTGLGETSQVAGLR